MKDKINRKYLEDGTLTKIISLGVERKLEEIKRQEKLKELEENYIDNIKTTSFSAGMIFGIFVSVIYFILIGSII